MQNKLYAAITALTFFYSGHVLANTALPCSDSDTKAIEKSIQVYLNKYTAIQANDTKIINLRCKNHFAKATIHPMKGETDDAFVWLKKNKQDWQVMTLGTNIDADLLKKLPKALQE